MRQPSFPCRPPSPWMGLAAILVPWVLSPALAADFSSSELEEAFRAGMSVEDADEAAGPTAAGPTTTLAAAVEEGTVILQDGDTPAGANGPVTSLNAPFTNGLGQVGFTGGADDGSGGADNFVWFNTGIALLDADIITPTLTGAESTMGVGNGGEFIYSPSVDGDDAVWTHNGLLQVEGTQAPGFAAGVNNTFNSRPQMRPNGQSYWVSGFNETGGITTQGRVLYTSSDSTPGNISIVLRSDDMIGGFMIARPSGIGFDYAFSDNGAHHIQSLLMDTGSTVDDGFLYVDGVLVAREGSPSGSGDNWDNFDNVSIDNAGNYLFSGDTDGSPSSDEFIAYSGVIAVREGDILDGQPLSNPTTIHALSLNNFGQAVHLWSIAGGSSEHLFFACDASDLAGSSVLVLSTGDSLDLDGDGFNDATVTDFNASEIIGPGLSLAEDGFLYVEVNLDEGAGDLESVLRIELPSCDSGPVAAPVLSPAGTVLLSLMLVVIAFTTLRGRGSVLSHLKRYAIKQKIQS